MKGVMKSITYFGVHYVAENCACANEDEQHQIEEEKYKCDDLQGLAIVVVWEKVDESRHYSGTHDYGVP